MVVLGIHSGHDSSAAIIRDGKIIADVQEERFSRIKHSANFPFKSIAYCLKMAGLDSINDVDYISNSEQNTKKTTRVIFDISESPNKTKNFLKKTVNSVFLGIANTDNLKLPIYYPDYRLKDQTKLINNNHHLAHAASGAI